MLDNDQDGCADDTNVVKKIRQKQSGMMMFKNEKDAEEFYDSDNGLETFRGQGLWADETEPKCSGKDESESCRDAAIEEIFHVVTAAGISQTYPSVFGECETKVSKISEMQEAMDEARGGHFLKVPDNYPSGAIYHYDDKTCDYACQGTEFFYWALTSILDGQNARAKDNEVEWEANTQLEVKNKAPKMYELLTNGKTTSMKLLSLDGELPGSGGSSKGARLTYKPSSQTCSSGCGLNGSGCGSLGNNPDVSNCDNDDNNNDDNNNDDNNNDDDDYTGCKNNPNFVLKIKNKKRKCSYFGKKNRSKRCRNVGVIQNCKTACKVCDKNGEQVCENRKLKKEACKAISCCEWNDGECWSKVGTEKCWQNKNNIFS